MCHPVGGAVVRGGQSVCGVPDAGVSGPGHHRCNKVTQQRRVTGQSRYDDHGLLYYYDSEIKRVV